MRCFLICSNGCGKYIVSRSDFSFHGDSPASEHLTHKFLLRYYLFGINYSTYGMVYKHIYTLCTKSDKVCDGFGHNALTLYGEGVDGIGK